MTHVDVQLAPLADLEGLLPRLLQNISLSRAQIAIDQLRGAIQSRGTDRIVLITATHPDHPDTPVAAAVAIQQPEADRGMATMIHAGPIDQSDDGQQSECMAALTPYFEDQLSQRGVGFVQWATDADPSRAVTQWCEGFGFRPVGTLDYLSGEIASASTREPTTTLRFPVVNLNDPSDYESFVRLVEETYQQTLDCPGLAEHRTASQTLQGYRTSAAMDPSCWFRVVQDGNDGTCKDVGCVILANHQPPSHDPEARGVIEIVYMGIVPSARGQRLGQRLVEHAFATARTRTASRMILAVDQQNSPAKAIYEAAGLSPMLSETVWVKTIGS